MTKTEFEFNESRFIFKEVAKSTNVLCGLSKTSSMVATLFTTLPLKVELRHLSYQPKPSKKLNALDEFVHAYLKHDDSTTVYIAFYYSDDKHIKRISKAIHKHPEFFTYLYMREALKLTRLMNTKTHYKMMSSLIKQNNPSIPINDHYRYSIMACNYVVNDTIQKLFANSPLSGKLTNIILSQPFNTSYSGQHETQVLLDLIKSDEPLPAPEPMTDEVSFDPFLGEPGMTNGDLLEDESHVTDLGESIQSSLGSMSRGGTSAALFGDFFTAKKVKTGWFKKIAAKFNSDVYYMTNTFRSQWSNLNVTYRHKFKAPKAQYEDNKLAVVLSIDQSGSVSSDALQKLLYLIEKHSNKITYLHILIHDTEIIKESVLQNNDDIKSAKDFDLLRYRVACGGTSHYHPMKRIAELITDRTIDPTKTIYISLSDNYSDIPASWKEFSAQLKQLSSVIFLTPQDNPVNINGTMDIAMS